MTKDSLLQVLTNLINKFAVKIDSIFAKKEDLYSVNGFYNLTVDSKGDLYVCYDDNNETVPTFEIDEEGNLYYVIEMEE